MKPENMHNFLENASSLHIAVIGDVMIDRYIKGVVKRRAPEAPVPVLSETSIAHDQLGGAGFVASLLAGYGVKTFMAGVVGDDAVGANLLDLLSAHSVHTDMVIKDSSRPTSLKQRFQRDDELLLRVDDEKTHDIDELIVQSIVRALKAIPKLDALIISDYGKGVVTSALMAEVAQFARGRSIPILVDPKGSDWSKYKGARIITPNKKELSEAAGQIISDGDIIDTARHLMSAYDIESILVTRSENGMDYIDDTYVHHQDSLVKNAVNVVGAGDQVMAVLAIGVALKQDTNDILYSASQKAALHIEGNKNTSDIKNASDHPWDKARAQIIDWQSKGLKVGFTNGCFDILHAGHVMYLNQAKSHCDKLVLGLNSDASVRLLKGPTRPINDEQDRMDVMMGLKAIDHVVCFGASKIGDDNTPSAVIEHLKPDIFFKGGDYTIDQLPEAKAVLSYGGVVKILGLLDGRSTTKIIEKSAQA